MSSRLLPTALVFGSVFATALVFALPVAAQDDTTTSGTPTGVATDEPVTVTVEDTVTATETAIETTTVEEKTNVELETWGWALVAAGATAVVLIAFAAGRASKRDRQRTGERLPAERNQTLLAALSGWLAEGWVIESQTSTEAVLRKGTERRLLAVDTHGSLSRSELPPLEVDPQWTAPAEQTEPPAD